MPFSNRASSPGLQKVASQHSTVAQGRSFQMSVGLFPHLRRSSTKHLSSLLLFNCPLKNWWQDWWQKSPEDLGCSDGPPSTTLTYSPYRLLVGYIGQGRTSQLIKAHPLLSQAATLCNPVKSHTKLHLKLYRLFSSTFADQDLHPDVQMVSVGLVLRWQLLLCPSHDSSGLPRQDEQEKKLWMLVGDHALTDVRFRLRDSLQETD